jgi:hypothetical protein
MSQKKGLEREVKRFLDEVVGSDTEHLELVLDAVQRILARRRER